MSRLIDEAEYQRLMRLDAAVRRMVTQRGDDICWRDLYTELAGLVGLPFVPELMYSRNQMLANCERFVVSLYDGGPYIPLYPCSPAEKADGQASS